MGNRQGSNSTRETLTAGVLGNVTANIVNNFTNSNHPATNPAPLLKSFCTAKPPTNIYEGNLLKLQEIHNIFQTKRRSASVLDRTVAITGMGGIGKSELARKYASEFSREYRYIAWIESETEDHLRTSFELVAGEIGLSTENVTSEQLASKVYWKLNFQTDSTQCNPVTAALFIFDNAMQMNSSDGEFGISKFLPHVDTQDCEFHVIITTQWTYWDNQIATIPMEILSEAETMSYFSRHFRLSNVNDEEELCLLLSELARVLQGYPLAIVLAASNVDYSPSGSDDLEVLRRGVREYLKTFDATFSTQTVGKYFSTEYNRTFAAVFEIALNRLKSLEDGKLAVEILYEISISPQPYISEQNLTRMFLGGATMLKISSIVMNDPSATIEKGVRLLERYGFVSVSRSTWTTVSVHRLVKKLMVAEADKSKGALDFDLALFPSGKYARILDQKIDAYVDCKLQQELCADDKKTSVFGLLISYNFCCTNTVRLKFNSRGGDLPGYWFFSGTIGIQLESIIVVNTTSCEDLNVLLNRVNIRWDVSLVKSLVLLAYALTRSSQNSLCNVDRNLGLLSGILQSPVKTGDSITVRMKDIAVALIEKIRQRTISISDIIDFVLSDWPSAVETPLSSNILDCESINIALVCVILRVQVAEIDLAKKFKGTEMAVGSRLEEWILWLFEHSRGSNDYIVVFYCTQLWDLSQNFEQWNYDLWADILMKNSMKPTRGTQPGMTSEQTEFLRKLFWGAVRGGPEPLYAKLMERGLAELLSAQLTEWNAGSLIISEVTWFAFGVICDLLKYGYSTSAKLESALQQVATCQCETLPKSQFIPEEVRNALHLQVWVIWMTMTVCSERRDAEDWLKRYLPRLDPLEKSKVAAMRAPTDVRLIIASVAEEHDRVCSKFLEKSVNSQSEQLCFAREVALYVLTTDSPVEKSGEVNDEDED